MSLNNKKESTFFYFFLKKIVQKISRKKINAEAPKS
jgi:hypothetical protein